MRCRLPGGCLPNAGCRRKSVSAGSFVPFEAALSKRACFYSRLFVTGCQRAEAREAASPAGCQVSQAKRTQGCGSKEEEEEDDDGSRANGVYQKEELTTIMQIIITSSKGLKKIIFFNGTVSDKPRRLWRHERAQAHNSTHYRCQHSFMY
jgi:hypothetical protein